MSEELIVETHGPVLWITINREARRNAVNAAVIGGIHAALDAADGDPAIRAVVLTGIGERAFCAGADLSSGSGSFEYDFARIEDPFAMMLRRGRSLSKPLIARINGHCVAGGLGLLGMCDLAVGVDSAKFGMPEVKIGVFPMMITSVLKDIIPRRKLYEMALSGEMITAEDALEIGLLNYAVPRDELDARLDWLLGRILDKSPTAIRRGKHALRIVADMPFDEALSFLESQISLVAMTEDAREGRSAFIEKRQPEWTGR